jgi:hypothetical protein
LSHAIILKIRHKTRLNIFGRYKIIINSQEVNLVIQRSHGEIEKKNLIIFSYKNHLYRIIINTKKFIIKALHSNFVQFLSQKLDMV